jgi:molybdopterin converting factor small subunit
MKILVKLFVTFRQYCPEGVDNTFEIDCDSEQTVGSFVELLNIPSSEQKVVLVNGHHSDENTKLFSGDTVTLYPPIAGG